MDEKTPILGTEETSDELGPCLIGSTHGINATFEDFHGVFYSIDKIRFELRFSPEKLDEILRLLDTWTLPKRSPRHPDSNKIGTYRILFSFEFEKSAIAVGVCHNTGTGRIDESKGFVEFNPNKVGKEGAELIRRLLHRGGVSFELRRYDMAIDFPTARDGLRVMKDGRKYACEISESITEYLGQRNKPGRVKVYDKAAQAGLDYPLTRVEITASADWSAEEIASRLPVVYDPDAIEVEGLSGITKQYVVDLMVLAKHGENVEASLRGLHPRTRAKVRAAMKKAPALTYSTEAVSEIVRAASEWVDRCADALEPR